MSCNKALSIFSSQDEVDKETIHLLVFLFMQFLSQADQAVIPGEKEALWSCLLAMNKICAMQAGFDSCHSSWRLPKVFLVSGGRETSGFQCLQRKVRIFDHHAHMRNVVPQRSFEKIAILKVFCWRTLESPVEMKFYCRFFFPFHQTGSLSSPRFSLDFFWLMLQSVFWLR